MVEIRVSVPESYFLAGCAVFLTFVAVSNSRTQTIWRCSPWLRQSNPVGFTEYGCATRRSYENGCAVRRTQQSLVAVPSRIWLHQIRLRQFRPCAASFSSQTKLRIRRQDAFFSVGGILKQIKYQRICNHSSSCICIPWAYLHIRCVHWVVYENKDKFFASQITKTPEYVEPDQPQEYGGRINQRLFILSLATGEASRDKYACSPILDYQWYHLPVGYTIRGSV
jgi:hypothetical protein